MQRLGIVLDFKTKKITIDDIILSVHEKSGNLQTQNALITIYGQTEPITTLRETK